MTLTLDIPNGVAETDAGRQEKLARAAVALFDAELLTQGQAAEMAGLSRVEFFDLLGRAGVSPFQYEWDDAWMDALTMAGKDGLGSQ